MVAWGACALVAASLAACGSKAAVRQTFAARQPVVQATTPAPPATTPTTMPPTPVPPTPVPTTTPPTPVTAVPGWSPPLTALPPGGGFTSVSCISDTFCIAAGGGANQADVNQTTGAGVTESWDGETWSEPSTYYPAPTSASAAWPVVPSIACTSGPFCVIVDGSGFISNGDGTNWITPVALQPASPLPANPADPGAGHPGSRQAAVACPSPTFCAIVSNTGDVYTWRHGSWLAPQAFGAAGSTVALYGLGRVGVSCPTTSSCTAVVGTAVLDWDGSTWSEEPVPWTPVADPHGAAVACPTTTLCAIVGGSGMSYRNGTTSWSAARAIDPGGVLDGVSCPSLSFCVAVDTGGSVVTWDGTSWSAPVRVLPTATVYTGLGTSVSCSSDEFCMVMDGDGDYSTYSPPAATGSTSASAGTAPG
ncbi:MAG: hypothetical protein ACLP2J_11070 [Acidimicrobiales bacterium]